MKSISLHPVSVLVGCALAGMVVLLLSAAQTVGGAHLIPTRDARLVGEIPAEWWTHVVLTSINGTPVQTYTVPQGHWFVVTAGNATGSTYADGQSVGDQLSVTSPGWGTSTRVAFRPGTILEDRYPLPTGSNHLWGYLEPVR